MENSAAVSPPATPILSEEDQRALLEVEEEIIERLAQLSVPQQVVLLELTTGSTVKDAAQKAGIAHTSVYPMMKLPAVREVRALLIKRWAIEYGVPRSWKREQLIHIIERHKLMQPAAAVAALRLLMELDGDLKTPLVQINSADSMIVATPEEVRALLGGRPLPVTIEGEHGDDSDRGK